MVQAPRSADPAPCPVHGKWKQPDGAASHKLLQRYRASTNCLVEDPRRVHDRKPAIVSAALWAAAPRSAARRVRSQSLLTPPPSRTSGIQAARANRSKPAPPAARD